MTEKEKEIYRKLIKSVVLPMTKKEIAAQNKRRSKAMEKSIAQYFNGNRVPMSGAGGIKGDCFIPYDEHRTIYVECKLTEKDILRIPATWLEEIIKNTKAMRCVFGILVYRFVGSRVDHVLLPQVQAIKLGIQHATIGNSVSTSFSVIRDKEYTDIEYVNLGIWSYTTTSKLRMALESLRNQD